MSAEWFVDRLPRLPERLPDSHKGTFGRVLAIGGSQGMSGSITLSAMSALRGGAGLVQAAVPAPIQDIVAAAEPSYMTAALPADDAGRIASAPPHEQIAELAKPATCVALGPGLGRSAALDDLTGWLYAHLEKPMVFDADALNALAALHGPIPAGQPRHAAARVLTPHPGEFSRLSGVSTKELTGPAPTFQPPVAAPTSGEEMELRLKSPSAEMSAHPAVHIARSFAAQWGVVLVLKGHRTIITDGQRVAVNTTGNPGMATGGSGDVLTGLIASLVAQGMHPFEAAQLGVHLHGLAGDLAAVELGMAGLIASDLVRFLPRAIRMLELRASGTPLPEPREN